MQHSIKKPLLAAGIVILLIIAFIAFQAWRINVRLWEEQAAAYDTKWEYSVSNNMTTLRTYLLRRGMSDTNTLYRFFERIHYAAYRDGLAKIPDGDGERYIWQYSYYLAPYVLAKVPPEQVGNRVERVDQATEIAINLPTTPMKNEWFDKQPRYALSYYSFEFAFNYATQGKPSKEDFVAMVHQAVWMIESVEAKMPPTTLDEKGAYGLYIIKAFQIAAPAITEYWLPKSLPCGHPAVGDYTTLRHKITGALPAVMADTEMKQLPPLEQISDQSVKADTILSKKCFLYHLKALSQTAKVVNSLFGKTWRIAEFGSTNCQLEFERCPFE